MCHGRPTRPGRTCAACPSRRSRPPPCGCCVGTPRSGASRRRPRRGRPAPERRRGRTGEGRARRRSGWGSAARDVLTWPDPCCASQIPGGGKASGRPSRGHRRITMKNKAGVLQPSTGRSVLECIRENPRARDPRQVPARRRRQDPAQAPANGRTGQRPRRGLRRPHRRRAARGDRRVQGAATPTARPSTTCCPRRSRPSARRPSAPSASGTTTSSSWAAPRCTSATSPR